MPPGPSSGAAIPRHRGTAPSRMAGTRMGARGDRRLRGPLRAGPRDARRGRVSRVLHGPRALTMGAHLRGRFGAVAVSTFPAHLRGDRRVGGSVLAFRPGARPGEGP